MLIISACLAGIKCRYNGKGALNKKALDLVSRGKAIPVCPEQLGGLPTPRPATEIKNNKVIDDKGKDYTKHYQIGAKEALKIAKIAGCKKAILKARSPSCGCGKIYDGTFSGKLIKGDGVFAKLLKKHKIKIKTLDQD